MTPRLTASGPPLAVTDLLAAEHRLNVALPDDYRAFLLANNGGKPRPAWFRHGKDASDVAEITRFFSLDEVETNTKDLRRGYDITEFIAIGTSSDTDFLMLSTAGEHRGSVVWNPSAEDSSPDAFIRISDSIDHFLTSLDYPESTKPWMMLIDNDDREGLQHWLDNGGDVQAGDDVVLDITALEHAAATGRLGIVKLLVNRGAKPRGGLRRSCPHRYAVQAGHRDVAAFLAQRGMAKGYWLHYLGIAASVLVAIGLSLVPQPRELLQNYVVLLFICVVVLSVGVFLTYDWLRRPGTGDGNTTDAPGRTNG